MDRRVWRARRHVKLCVVDGCGNKRNGQGLCGTHQRRMRVHGDLNRGRPAAVIRYCEIGNCGKRRELHGMCQMHAWRVNHFGDPLYVRPRRLCSVDECRRRAKGNGLCLAHYSRQRQGVPLDWQRPKLSSKRYRQVKQPGHPLADKSGRVYFHRRVLFESIGFTRVPCFWCGVALVFGVGLVVDHLDHDRHNNALRNLAPACNGCNAGRTRASSHVRTSMYSAHFPVDTEGAKVGT